MSGLKRIIAHWSVTNYEFNDLSAEHYHFMVNGRGEVRSGDHKPEANIKPEKGNYAAHTLNCNTGSIGIACMAMAGAKSVTNYGHYPILEVQFEAMCKKIAELCVKYKIAVSPTTVLSHAEVQTNLGIKQRGKWDIAVLPYAQLTTAKDCGDHMRRRVRAYMAGAKPADAKEPAKAVNPATMPKPAPVTPAAPRVAVVGFGAAIAVTVAGLFWSAACIMPQWFIEWAGYAAKCTGVQ